MHSYRSKTAKDKYGKPGGQTVRAGKNVKQYISCQDHAPLGELRYLAVHFLSLLSREGSVFPADGSDKRQRLLFIVDRVDDALDHQTDS